MWWNKRELAEVERLRIENQILRGELNALGVRREVFLDHTHHGSGWLCGFCKPPNFQVMGFHTKRTCDVMLQDGRRIDGAAYHGYDVWGKDGEEWNDVPLWKPSAAPGDKRHS